MQMPRNQISGPNANSNRRGAPNAASVAIGPNVAANVAIGPNVGVASNVIPNAGIVRNARNVPYQRIKFIPATHIDRRLIMKDEYDKIFTNSSPLKRITFESFFRQFETFEKGDDWDEDVKNYVKVYKDKERKLLDAYLTGVEFESKEVSDNDYNPEFIKLRYNDLKLDEDEDLYLNIKHESYIPGKGIVETSERIRKPMNQSNEEFSLFNEKNMLGTKRERELEFENQELKNENMFIQQMNNELNKKLQYMENLLKKKDSENAMLRMERDEFKEMSTTIECPICLVRKPKNQFCSVSCGHCFCVNCIGMMINSRMSQCPMCKNYVSFNGARRIYI